MAGAFLRRPASPTFTSNATTSWSPSDRRTPFPGSRPTLGVAFGEDGLPAIDPVTFQSSLPSVFFGGDAALGPKNIITAVAHGHEAAISIDAYCRRRGPASAPGADDQSRQHRRWASTSGPTITPSPSTAGSRCRQVESAKALKSVKTEVELGFTDRQALAEARRCLNCDVETVFSAPACIECDACVDICPMDCISFVPNAPEEELRRSLSAPALNLTQAIYVSEPVKTGRIMAKDEDLCLHCGLCAERCPTGAWDMRKFTIELAQAGHACRSTL